MGKQLTMEEQATARIKVMNCTCAHLDQDWLYGYQRRLHSRAGKDGEAVQGWRCSVCGVKKSIKEG